MFLIFQVVEVYFLNHNDFGVYFFVQTNFAFQFTDTTKFRLVHVHQIGRKRVARAFYI